MQCGKYVPNTELRLNFVKSGDMTGNNIPTMRDGDFEKEFIRKPVNIEEYFAA